jgi:hypothetical protein
MTERSVMPPAGDCGGQGAFAGKASGGGFSLAMKSWFDKSL